MALTQRKITKISQLSDYGDNLTWAGTATFENYVTIQPATDSATAVQVLDKDGGVPVLNIDTTNERVGVGTASPLTILHLLGPSPTITLTDTAAMLSAKIEMDDNDVIITNTVGTLNADIIFTTASEAMRIKGGGNVGIGETIPTAQLHVAGDALFQNATDSTTAFQVLDADGGTPVLNVDTTNERVGIGTASPVGKLELQDGIFRVNDAANTGGTRIEFFRGGNQLGLWGTDADILTMMGVDTDFRISGYKTGVGALEIARFGYDSGDVGIGTTTPTAKLDVAGSKADKVTTVAAATYTIAITDRTIVVDYTTTGAVTLTLPSCTTAWNSTNSTGIVFVIKDLDCNAGTNNITINRAGSDTIIDTAAGQTSTVINGNGNAIRIQAVSTTEWIVF